MKAYIVTTGAIFAIVTVLHALETVQQLRSPGTSANEIAMMGVLGLAALALTIWAVALLRRENRSVPSNTP